MKLIVGLGNPGANYKNTRHNVGFLMIDKLTSAYNLHTSVNKKFNSEIAEYKTATDTILLVKPLTFMNNSGQAVRALMDFYKLKNTDVIVIHDEKDIIIGTYKIQTNRGSAGHNGVQSIMDHLGTKDFKRVRIGIAPLDKKVEVIEEFVMSKFTKEEREILEEVTIDAIEQIKKIALL
jgi:PTH1 family peptidyl-tRNA hydrolase